MKNFITIILLFVFGLANAQVKILASSITETTTKQFVSATQKTTWNAAATQAKNAAIDANEALTQAQEANREAIKVTRFIQGPGVTIKQIDDSTYLISSEYPPRLTTKQRDTLDLKASRGMLIYSLDDDELYKCNGARWDKVTTGISITQPPMTAPRQGTANLPTMQQRKDRIDYLPVKGDTSTVKKKATPKKKK